METLKLKIFEVLTEKISVSEFENWLYESEEILDNLLTNDLYFEVITINFKSKNWTSHLNNAIQNYFNEDYLEILRIKKICIEVLNAKTYDEIYVKLKELSKDFNCDTDYFILWKLYILYDYFELVKDGYCQRGTLHLEAKFYAKEALKIIQKSKNFDDIKIKLEEDLEPFEISKNKL